jgi:hypothetical protein
MRQNMQTIYIVFEMYTTQEGDFVKQVSSVFAKREDAERYIQEENGYLVNGSTNYSIEKWMVQ